MGPGADARPPGARWGRPRGPHCRTEPGLSAETDTRPPAPRSAQKRGAGFRKPRSRRHEGPAYTCSAKDAELTSWEPGEGSGGWGPRAQPVLFPPEVTPEQDLAPPAFLSKAPSHGTPALTTQNQSLRASAHCRGAPGLGLQPCAPPLRRGRLRVFARSGQDAPARRTAPGAAALPGV